MSIIIGRAEEQKILQLKKTSTKAELIAVLGRRRVGKTYLIRNYFAKEIAFELTGIHDTTLRTQCQNFTLPVYLDHIF